MPSVISEGEFSLFYFNDRYNHAILKIPTKGDFRVQEEHGGRLSTIEPEKQLFAAAKTAITAIPFSTLLCETLYCSI